MAAADGGVEATNARAFGPGQRRLFLLVSLLAAALSAGNFWFTGRQAFSSNAGGVEGLIDGPNDGTTTGAVPNDATNDTGAAHVGATAPPSTHLRVDVNATKSTASNASLHTNTSFITATAQKPPILNGTVVVQLMGELGNNLSVLAYYFAVRTLAAEEFNLHLTLHVRKQNHTKAHRAAANLKCLKSLRDVDYDECDWSMTDGHGTSRGMACAHKIDRQMSAFQELMLSQKPYNHTIMNLAQRLGMQGSTSDEIRSFLQSYVAVLRDEAIMGMYRTKDIGWNADERHPFLFNTERQFASDALLDDFYEKGLQEYFAFDDETKIESGCCAMLPKDDEQVFHYRSFAWDLPRKVLSWGGAELRPQPAANILSASLSPGTKIAFVPGRATQNRVAAYIEAFRNASFDVRDIAGQTSIQDFCFLSHAKAGLWGTRQSSYVTWASLISRGLRNATLYGVNYPSRERNVTARVSSNAKLAKVVRYPVFDVSDEDVW